MPDDLFSLFVQEVHVGDEVHLFLPHGRELQGRVKAISETSVSIQHAKGTATVSAQMLGAWEVITAGGTESPPSPPPPPSTGNGVAAPSRLEVAAPPPVAPPTAELLRLVEIEASYRVAAQHARLILKGLIEDFPVDAFPLKDQEDMRRGWVRARNKYADVLKHKPIDLSRLHPIVAILREIHKQHPQAGAVSYNIGYYLSRLEQPGEALPAFEEAVETSGLPAAMYNAAVASQRLGDRARACSWLARYCVTPRDPMRDDAWYVLVRLAGEIKAHDVWEEMLGAIADGEGDPSAVPLIFEAAACFLKQAGRREDALAALALGSPGDRPPQELAAAFAPLAASLKAEASPEWQEFRERRRAERERWLEKQGKQIEAERLRLALARSRLQPSGHVIQFMPEKGYGYIRDDQGRRSFFHDSHIIDNRLREAVRAMRPGEEIPVFCEFKEVGGGVQAHNVQACRTEEELLESAKQWASNGKLAQALAELAVLLRAVPDHAEALRLQEAWKDAGKPRAPVRQAQLPRDDTPYWIAKRAAQEGDFETAERFFLEAIRIGDKAQSAIKDLASILQQQGRQAEAAKVLETHLGRFTANAERRSALNQLITCLQHSGQYDEAIKRLNELMPLVPAKQVTEVQRRVALCQYHKRDYDSMERTLRAVLKATPGDLVAQKWLTALQKARESGRYEEANKLFSADELVEYSHGISPILNFALDREPFEYIGLRKEVILTRAFSEETLVSLEGYIKSLGFGRPREKAQCYLTAARLLRDLGSEDHHRFRTYLREYSATIGDSAALEHRPMDVVRTFYAETFFVEQHWGTQLNHTASKFLLSYVFTQDELLTEHTPNLPRAVEAVFQSSKVPAGFWNGVLDICVINTKAVEIVLPVFYQNRKAFEASRAFLEGFTPLAQKVNLSLEEFLRCWVAARTKRNAEYEECFQKLQSAAPSRVATAEIGEFQKVLQNNRHTWFCQLDVQRMDRLENIAKSLDGFCRQTAFEERERHQSNAVDLIDKLLREIEENPTRLSIMAFHPLLESLRETAEKAKEELLQSSQPKISLSLAVDNASPNKDGLLSLQIAVANAQGCSPISNTALVITDKPGLYKAQEPVYGMPESIRGGEKKIIECYLQVTEDAVNARAISLEVRPSYRDRRDEQVELPASSLTLNLYASSEFEKIENPFAKLVQSGAVEDPKMFIGRDEIIDTIHRTLKEVSAKGFVLYGQKRSGKTSVVQHLRRRLNNSEQFLNVYLTLGELLEEGEEFSTKNLLYTILRRMRQELEDISSPGVPLPPLVVPSFNEFRENTLVQFFEILEQFNRDCRKFDSWRSRKVVVTIDEFTYLYTQIKKRGGRGGDFMKTWKAMLDTKLFSAVLVGQDVMPEFMKMFANEFAGMHPERLTYLSRENASRLLQEPIRISPSGESRLKARAVDRALELTAGNPFFVVMLGHRLTDHMNNTRRKYATEVEVNAAVREMVSEANRLTPETFDGLLTAGDRDVEDIPEAQRLAVLGAIANGSADGIARRSAIVPPGVERVDDILEDLLRRDVIEQPQAGYYRIKVGLFREWLLANPRS